MESIAFEKSKKRKEGGEEEKKEGRKEGKSRAEIETRQLDSSPALRTILP